MPKLKSNKPEPILVGNISIEGARIGFRNFAGKKGQYNPEGNRNFCVFLDDDFAEKLHNDGWNVRWLEPRDPEDDRQAYMQVKVSYVKIPPKIVAITSHNKRILDEGSINILDWAEIKTVDLIIRPYSWDVNGKTGIKAYVKSMYITLVEDEFEGKYRDVPDSAASSVVDDGEPPF